MQKNWLIKPSKNIFFSFPYLIDYGEYVSLEEHESDLWTGVESILLVDIFHQDTF